MRPVYLISAVLVVGGGVVLSPGLAFAQQVVGYQSLPGRASVGSEGGVKLNDDLMLHVGAGTELGYDSNVYYQDSSGTQGSSILRVLGFAELTNALHGEVPSGLFFDFVANLVYRQYFTDQIQSSDVKTAFMPTLAGTLEFSSGQQLGLGLGDSFTRSEDPPYDPNQGPITRNTNTGSVQLRWSPGGGRLQGVLRYTNVIDQFDGTYSYASSMSNELMADGSWRWFPKTALFVNVRQGYVSYFNSTASANLKVSSLPFHATVGLRGLITEKTSVNLAVGYTNGFYSSGPNLSGFGSLSASADLSYRPIQTTNIAVGYQHDFQNSLIGNYYSLDGFRASLQQMLFERLILGATALYQNRRFSNAPAAGAVAGTTVVGPRTDNFFQVGASLDYHVKSWGYFGAVYNLFANSSDAQVAVGGGGSRTASYTKYQILGRVGIVF